MEIMEDKQAKEAEQDKKDGDFEQLAGITGVPADHFMKMHAKFLDDTGGDIWSIEDEEEFAEAFGNWIKRKIPFKYRLKRQALSPLERQDKEYR